MIRTKGEAGTGNVVEAVRHQRAMLGQIAEVSQLRPEQHVSKAKGSARRSTSSGWSRSKGACRS